MKLVYSKNELIKKAKKEIALITKKIKDKKKELRKAKKAFSKAKKYSERNGKVFEYLNDTLKLKIQEILSLKIIDSKLAG